MLKEEGYEVVLVNLNLVIIMIDKEIVDYVYIELIILEFVLRILWKECFDVFLLILGG